MSRSQHRVPRSRSRWTGIRSVAVLLFQVSLLAALPPFASAARAQEDEPEESEQTRLQVHGFLSQAYAVSDGDTILGITDSGTTDYRSAALQLRYRMSDRGSFALQLAHERLGESFRADLQDDVELDWIFYHHRLGDYTDLKVGRVPIPRGIFNEILDVGTALPFYRPPLDLYGESAFVSEAIDGAVLSHSLSLDAGWLVEVDGYYGGWSTYETTGDQVAEATVGDAVGGQLWVLPPITGLRVGLAAQTYLVEEGLLRPPGTKDRWDVWVGSVEWNRPRFVVRAEVLEGDSPTATYRAYYGQVGVRLTRDLTLNAQVERADLDVPPIGLNDLEYDRTETVGLAYAFSSDLVAKAEVHRSEGYFHVEDPAPSLFGPPEEATYGILSLSVSF